MKKVILLGMVCALFTVAASAQQSRNDFRSDRSVHQRFDNGQLTRGEKYKLHKNDKQYSRAKKHFKKDGRVSHMERRKLSKMRHNDRRQAFRYRHNDRRS